MSVACLGVGDGVNDKGSRDWRGTFEVNFVCILMLNKEFVSMHLYGIFCFLLFIFCMLSGMFFIKFCKSYIISEDTLNAFVYFVIWHTQYE